MVVRCLTVVCALLALSGCRAPRPTTVALTFKPAFEAPPAGRHYALFVSVNGGAVGLLEFTLRPAPASAGTYLEVVDHRNRAVVVGTVDGVDAFGRPVGGVELRVADDLTGAEELFITREVDGDTDPAPSLDVVMVGTLTSTGADVLGTVLLPPIRSDVVGGSPRKPLGTAALVLPNAELNGL